MERPPASFHRTPVLFLAAVAALAFLWGRETALAAPLRRVLILDSFGREFAPYNALIGVIKTEMARQSSEPIEFHEVPIEMARFSESAAEKPLVEYIGALFADRHLDLMVPLGGAAMRFWARHRDELFPTAPTLIAGVEQRHVQDVPLSATQTAVAVRLDLPGMVEDILRLRPETKRIAVVLGDSPLERFWITEARREWQPFAARVEFIWWNDLPFEAMRLRAAALPPQSCILYVMMSVDAHGVPHEDEQALTILHAEANAPLFGLFTTQLGRGIVGGRLLDIEGIGRTTASVALRILAGERPESIHIATIGHGTPTYDWRELQRWNIHSAALPAGSVVLHRLPNAWERYRGKIVLGLGIIVAQGLALAGLLVQRSRRRRAERESQERRRELLHATRVSAVGELTASLAHELHQPLGAILRNAEAAELLMQKTPPDLEELRAILVDIREDDSRASRVIDGLRDLLRRHEVEYHELSVPDLFDEVWMLSRGDAASRGMRLQMNASADLPRIKGDRVHLVQVLLNLVANAMDACAETGDGERMVSVQAQQQNGHIEVAVSDSGHGILAEHLERVFAPFHTTKAKGLGLGLSISRSIVEAHGGRVWVSNNPRRGATFRFTLPIASRGDGA